MAPHLRLFLSHNNCVFHSMSNLPCIHRILKLKGRHLGSDISHSFRWRICCIVFRGLGRSVLYMFGRLSKIGRLNNCLFHMCHIFLHLQKNYQHIHNTMLNCYKFYNYSLSKIDTHCRLRTIHQNISGILLLNYIINSLLAHSECKCQCSI